MPLTVSTEMSAFSASSACVIWSLSRSFLIFPAIILYKFSLFSIDLNQAVELIDGLVNPDTAAIATSEEWLRDVGETSPFDTIDFVDAAGMQHSSGREAVNVSDRTYYQRAMAGESGIECIFNTRLTHENLIYFYAPVREGADGPVIGLLLAHYSEERLTELLQGSFFGYESHVLLCLPTGEVVAASDGSLAGFDRLREQPEALLAEGSGPASDYLFIEPDGIRPAGAFSACKASHTQAAACVSVRPLDDAAAQEADCG